MTDKVVEVNRVNERIVCEDHNWLSPVQRSLMLERAKRRKMPLGTDC